MGEAGDDAIEREFDEFIEERESSAMMTIACPKARAGPKVVTTGPGSRCKKLQQETVGKGSPRQEKMV